ncbi:MAG: 2-amino-4-hydroxy-6-hydroxymethyldihydropteridine diphosphokinase [Micrococcales bacterium]
MSKSIKAVLALGGNLGDRHEHIRLAVEQLGQVEGVKVKRVSPLVESHAVTTEGVDESKPKYLNAVAEITTTLKPKELLSAIRAIETSHGRVRIDRWGSRTLDIDIITFGDLIKDSKELTIPHPRAFQRAFVLVPWMLMDGDAVIPGHGLVSELAEPVANQVWVTE